MASDLTDRIDKAAELLAVKPKSLTESLESNGIKNDSTGVFLLEASSTSLEDIICILQLVDAQSMDKKKLQLKAAASILKGEDPFKKQEEAKPKVAEASNVQVIADIIKSTRPLEQHNDRELLERYVLDRDHQVEQELNKRARQQNFVLLKPGKFEPGKEEIDIENSLDLLKLARKRTNPTITSIDGKVLPIYKITELNLEDRILDLCPICGESLYRGYCEQCTVSFEGIGDDERAYVALISKSDNFNPTGHSDKKAVVTSATKGLEDLKTTWPSLVQVFDELKLTGDLPKLRIIANRPSKADPFFQNGSRVFGHKQS